ncbi:MAG TPA: sigma factor-like helix-turn-helix DNA-binding protein [Chryseolinea sp.]|nr:sigma factor-like helix-turn-helix DNA-binding protein [Chryseolinea sp.]
MEPDQLERRALTTQLNRYQSMLLPFAYNVTGDFMAAEDIVQEVLNHHFLNSKEHIENPDHYLIRSVINRAINQKNLLRNKMEQYPGRWLPAPVITEEGIYTSADRGRILQYSLLVLLERLNAKERAVFILKETFDFNHEEIAEILNINTEHSRQLLKRGKKKIIPSESKAGAVNAESKQLLEQLVEAISAADIEKTKSLLAQDVECVSDGGPKMTAARKMLVGQERVSKFLKAIYGKYLPPGTSTTFAVVNHFPAIIFKVNGEIFRCIVFEMEGEIIRRIFIMVNPDKLQGLVFS